MERFTSSKLLAACVTNLALALLAAGCQRDNTRAAPIVSTTPAGQTTAESSAAAEKRDKALVRVVHAVPATSTVDIFADDTRVFDNLAYQSASAYKEIDGQRYTFHLRPAGINQAAPLASNMEGLSNGQHYTMFVMPGDGEAAALRVVADRHATPTAGKARVRVVHASSDAGNLDLYAPGRTGALFDNVNFQAVTDYAETEPVHGSLEIRPDGDSNAMLTVANVRFEAGKTYTLVILGRVRTVPKLDTLVIEDHALPAAPR